MHTRLKAPALLGATALAIAAPLTIAPPAHAAGPKCSAYQEKTFSTPGGNPTVKLRVCIRITPAGKGYIAVEGSWKGGGGPLEVDKFDAFEIRLFLERNQNTYSNNNAGDPTANINNNDSGEYEREIGPFSNGTGGSLPSGKWTADGEVRYNINNDGESGYVWPLTGSPSITI